MTQEWIYKVLIELGFRQQDAQVYIFLALNGPKKASDIADALKTHRRGVYRSLNNLQALQVLENTPTTPAYFQAIPFDKVLDLLIKTNLKQAQQMEKKKAKILRLWKTATACE